MSTIRKSARAPGAIRPRSSRPSARAPPIVAAVKKSAAPTACAWPAATRARIAAVRNSSTKLCGKVSVDIQRDTGGTISPEILEQDTAPREHRRAVRYGCTGCGKVAEVVAGRPVQPGMMVEEDRVADNRIGTEHADLAQPFDRRFAVPPHDLVKLGDALRRVDLERQPALARRRGAVAQQRFGAGVDLGGIKHPVETAGRVLARPVDQPKRAVESIPSGLFVPGVTHLVAIRREPPPERNIGAT